jgi:hypothetical protein
MYRIVGVVLLLLPGLPAAGAADKPKGTPAEQYQALVKDYQNEVKDAKSFPERMKLAQKYAAKFLDLAEMDPKDPAAVDALVWVVANVQGQQDQDNARAKAIERLARDHATSDKVGPVCLTLGRSFDKPSGDFLHAVLDKNPSRDAQGQACFALAQYLKNVKKYAEILKDNPDIEQRLENFAGKDAVAEMKKRDLAKVDKEVVELLERAADKYADVKAGGRTIADLVKPDLFEIQHLSVGKEAPEIEAEDIDGKKFKLSDYRGKVVLLDFWGNW